MTIPRCACFQHVAQSAYYIKAQSLLNENLPRISGDNGGKVLKQWDANVLIECSMVNENFLAETLNFHCCFSVTFFYLSLDMNLLPLCRKERYEGWFRSDGGNVELVLQACATALLHDMGDAPHCLADFEWMWFV